WAFGNTESSSPTAGQTPRSLLVCSHLRPGGRMPLNADGFIRSCMMFFGAE
ncbi:hypothetical protein ILYODFUR_021816, partial [Ilyodon furcidens]